MQILRGSRLNVEIQATLGSQVDVIAGLLKQFHDLLAADIVGNVINPEVVEIDIGLSDATPIAELDTEARVAVDLASREGEVAELLR